MENFFSRLQNFFLRLNCFLIGYNYGIIRNASEVSAKMVRRYASAVYIVSILWGVIGYSFADRYLKFGVGGSLLVSSALIFIVIQIERQIILSVGRNIALLVFRSGIAAVMALIGAIILDQVMFKEDIEQRKIATVQERVNAILPSKTAELVADIKAHDSLINSKQLERDKLAREVSRSPSIKRTTRERRNLSVRRADRDTIETRTDEISQEVENPKIAMIERLDAQIASLRTVLYQKQSLQLSIRGEIEKELKEKTGLLDEFNIMLEIIASSWASLLIWFAFFFFFLCIELLVAASKFFEKGNNEYERIILQQMELNLARLSTQSKPS